MPSVPRHLLFLVETNKKQIPRFALHHTVRGFARDDMVGVFFISLFQNLELNTEN